ncbi:MAG: agmatine deiminase family protein [Candidatus Margulisiibacteriota bacterium]|jgi:agmatine deiminase
MSDKLVDKNKFMMPAEWEKHSATWFAWPNDDDYFEDRIKNIEKIYLEIIKALHKDELIKLLVLNEKKEKEIKLILQEFNIDLSKIIFYKAEYFDVWMRDYGPIFVKNNEKKDWVKFTYDGYGGKFPELLPDNKVFLNLKDSINFKMIESDFVLEGGAIDSNGLGTILTTEECLLNNRNKNKNKAENEIILKKLLGVKKIVWLPLGLLNDHTDGHIDEVARFVGPSKILCAYEDDEKNKNYEILKNSTDQDGNKFEIIKLPMPHMIYDKSSKEFNGKQAPVSYANFYIGNKTVLVSIFNDQNDEKAISIIQSCFPDRKVIGIDCRDLIYGGGTIHCITQQEPE